MLSSLFRCVELLHSSILTAASITVCLFIASCASSPIEPDERVVHKRSIEVADRFQSALQQRLLSALKVGGPIAAVSVCKEVALNIATAETESSGATVKRIALRHRNSRAGVPNDLRDQYEALATSPIRDGLPNTRQWIDGKGDARRVNFLRAIPMQEQPCGSCHGTNIAPAVAEHIRKLYPDDQATGFSPGELRGALLVSWPLSAFAE